MSNNLNVNEFKVFGVKIEYFSILYGSFLVFWGVIVSFMSGSNSITSFIPSIIGLPILIFSNLSLKFESQKKLFMHIVAFFGLVALLGGLDVIRSFLNESLFSNFWADISKLMMSVTGFFFITQCVKSFIHARKIKDIKN
tara:strand:- start:220 stop:639 length:420 start_codon:yes stop_codon:yes gene_type:complete